jgi:hypothetical protein
MPTQLLPLQVIQALEALSGITLAAVLIVLSIVLFVGPYRFARSKGLGTAHAVGAGIGGLGFVFLFLITLQMFHSPL